MRSTRALKAFLLSWFSFTWFFVSVIAPMNGEVQRSTMEWLIRGLLGGIVVGLLTAYVEHRRHAKASSEPLPSEEV